MAYTDTYIEHYVHKTKHGNLIHHDRSAECPVRGDLPVSFWRIHHWPHGCWIPSARADSVDWRDVQLFCVRGPHRPEDIHTNAHGTFNERLTRIEDKIGRLLRMLENHDDP